MSVNNLLTTNFGDKELQEAISVHIDANFRIRSNLIDALDNVPGRREESCAPLRHGDSLPFPRA